MRQGLKVAALLLAMAPAVALAQEVDSDYRLYDRVYLRDVKKPLKGTILEGREQSASRLKIRLVGGIVHEVRRVEVERVVDRQTPESAFKTRAKALTASGSAALHRRLAEWGYGLGLIKQARGELGNAIRVETDAEAKLGHRVRLVELLEESAAELEGDERDAMFEAILAQTTQAEQPGPRLALGQARIALALTLPEVALPLLEQARATLEAKARTGAPPGGAGDDDGGEGAGDGDDGGEGAGDGDDGGEGAGDGDDGGEGDGDDAGGPPRRFGRDGAPLNPRRAGAPEDGGGGGDGAQPDDFSPQKLPGLSEDERGLYRDVLTTLASAALQLEKDEAAGAAYARLLEIWPQDAAATLGHARVLASRGDTARGIDAITETLKVFPGDPDLLLTRGRLHYLARHDQPAQSDLQRVLSSAKDKAGPLARRAGVALGLVHMVAGRFKRAKETLDAADAEPGDGQAKLAKALLAELSGDLQGARGLYDDAQRLLAPTAGEVRYSRAFSLEKAGQPEEAGEALRDAVSQGYPFRLAARALIDIARRSGDTQGEGRMLELLYRSTPEPDVGLLAGLGRAYLTQRKIDEARALFTRGLEAAPDDTACLSGLAYCAYDRGDRARAKSLFEKVLALDAKSSWARQGLKNLKEASTRRVWIDTFDRAKGDVLGGWKVESPYGVRVAINADGRLAFSGEQENEADGKTRVLRTVTGERVVKFEVHFTTLGDNAGRLGIRFETGSGKAVLFRDPDDGHVRASIAQGKRGFGDALDMGPWPGPGTHALAIDVEDPKKGTVAFLVDGQRRGSAKLPGSGRGRRSFGLVIYGQGQALGDTVRFVADEARVYVLRSSDSSGSSGGGY